MDGNWTDNLDKGRQRLFDLANSFPILAGRLVDYDIERRHGMEAVARMSADARLYYVLEAIAGGPFGSGGARAAEFCLHVLNDDAPFNLARAVNTWDQGNRAAFQAWAANPWTL